MGADQLAVVAGPVAVILLVWLALKAAKGAAVRRASLQRQLHPSSFNDGLSRAVDLTDDLRRAAELQWKLAIGEQLQAAREGNAEEEGFWVERAHMFREALTCLSAAWAALNGQEVPAWKHDIMVKYQPRSDYWPPNLLYPHYATEAVDDLYQDLLAVAAYNRQKAHKKALDETLEDGDRSRGQSEAAYWDHVADELLAAIQKNKWLSIQFNDGENVYRWPPSRADAERAVVEFLRQRVAEFDNKAPSQ